MALRNMARARTRNMETSVRPPFLCKLSAIFGDRIFASHDEEETITEEPSTAGKEPVVYIGYTMTHLQQLSIGFHAVRSNSNSKNEKAPTGHGIPRPPNALLAKFAFVSYFWDFRHLVPFVSVGFAF